MTGGKRAKPTMMTTQTQQLVWSGTGPIRVISRQQPPRDSWRRTAPHRTAPRRAVG